MDFKVCVWGGFANQAQEGGPQRLFCRLMFPAKKSAREYLYIKTGFCFLGGRLLFRVLWGHHDAHAILTSILTPTHTHITPIFQKPPPHPKKKNFMEKSPCTSLSGYDINSLPSRLSNPGHSSKIPPPFKNMKKRERERETAPHKYVCICTLD